MKSICLLGFWKFLKNCSFIFDKENSVNTRLKVYKKLYIIKTQILLRIKFQNEIFIFRYYILRWRAQLIFVEIRLGMNKKMGLRINIIKSSSFFQYFAHLLFRILRDKCFKNKWPKIERKTGEIGTRWINDVKVSKLFNYWVVVEFFTNHF